MKVTAELRNWEYDYMFHIYWGTIWFDSKERWPSGTRIRTSKVLNVEDVDDHIIVTTLNSTYKLYKNQQMGTTHGTQVTRRRHEGFSPSQAVSRNEDETDRL